MRIPVDQIRPTSTPIREVESEDTDALTHSIKEFGLLQPFRVRPVDDGYEVIFGNARLEAAKRAGFKEVEVVVVEVDDDQALIQAGVENLLRTDMSDPEKGKWSQKVRERMGWSQQEFAKRVGVSLRRVSQWELLATRLAPDLADLVVPPQRGGVGHEVPEGRLSASQAREIAILDTGRDQRRLAQKVIQEHLPGEVVREVRQAVQEAPDEKTVEKILERPWIKTRDEVAEEIEEEEIGVLAKEIGAEIAKEEERRWWEEHPMTKQFLEMLRRHMRLMRRGYESVEREKIPAEHCNYLAKYIEDNVMPLHREIVDGLKEKAKKWQ